MIDGHYMAHFAGEDLGDFGSLPQVEPPLALMRAASKVAAKELEAAPVLFVLGADSVWAPRTKESDARSFWNSDKVLKKMLDRDFLNLDAVPRFATLLARLGGSDKGAAAVTSPSNYKNNSVDLAMDGASARAALLKGLQPLYSRLVHALEYYSAIDANDDPFDMSMNAWLRFCVEAQLIDEPTDRASFAKGPPRASRGSFAGGPRASFNVRDSHGSLADVALALRSSVPGLPEGEAFTEIPGERAFCLLGSSRGGPQWTEALSAPVPAPEPVRSPNASSRRMSLDSMPSPRTLFTLDMAQRLFIQVNVEQSGAAVAKLNAVNDDNSLMRHEMTEAVLRVVEIKYARPRPLTEAVTADDLVAPLRRLAEEHLAVLPTEATADNDVYRRERLYTLKVEQVMKKFTKILKSLWDACGSANPVMGRTTFGLKEWITLLEAAGMMPAEMSRKDARLVFLRCRMRYVDEASDRHKFTTITFVSFLEAMARMVDLLELPSPKALAAVDVTSLTDFYEHVGTLPDADAAELLKNSSLPADAPLGDKLDLGLPYFIQALAVKCNGELHVGSKKVKLKHYLSKRQRDEWLYTDVLPKVRRGLLATTTEVWG